MTLQLTTLSIAHQNPTTDFGGRPGVVDAFEANVPPEIDGRLDVAIHKSACKTCRLLLVAHSDSVQTFGDFVFFDGDYLKTIDFESKSPFRKIDEAAFKRCDLLEKIVGRACEGCKARTKTTLYETLQTFNSQSFNNRDFLAEFETSPRNRNFRVADGGLLSVVCKTLWRLPTKRGGAFVVPDDVEVPFACALLGCPTITTFELLNSLQPVGKRAFFRCRTLLETSLPRGVKTLCEKAFHRCKSLFSTSFKNNSTFAAVGKNSFAANKTLIRVAFSKQLRKFGDSAFNFRATISPIIFVEGLKKIVGDAFKRCFQFTQTTFLQCVKIINKSVFFLCGLAKIDLPDGFETIKKSAFTASLELKRVSLPDTLKTLGPKAFAGCVLLTETLFKEGFATICLEKFWRRRSRASVETPPNLRKFGAQVGRSYTAAWRNRIGRLQRNRLLINVLRRFRFPSPNIILEK